MTVEASLSASAEGRDARAQLGLARDLLSASDGTKEDFLRALALVEAASAAGESEATNMLALFEAMGIGRPQSWERAFDTLRLAAEQGSVSAQEQLNFLWNASSDVQADARTSPASWSDKRKALSLDRLLRHPERRALCDKPRVRIIEGFASAAECRWLIDRARSRLKSALIFDAEGRQIVDPGRTNRGTEFQLLDMDLVIEMIRARISAAIRVPVPVFEPMQILHYSPGQQFKEHFDFLDPANAHHQEQMRKNGQRIATFLVYLNDDFEGGATEFPEIALRYRGNAGDALFWANCDMEGRPDRLTRHAGLPPTSGEKWILSQWIRDRSPSSR